VNDRTEDASDLARRISDFLNHGGDAATLVENLMSDHRTLQQKLVREVVWPLLKAHAEAHARGWYDLRNEGTVTLAARLVDAAGEHVYLPFV